MFIEDQSDHSVITNLVKISYYDKKKDTADAEAPFLKDCYIAKKFYPRVGLFLFVNLFSPFMESVSEFFAKGSSVYYVTLLRESFREMLPNLFFSFIILNKFFYTLFYKKKHFSQKSIFNFKKIKIPVFSKTEQGTERERRAKFSI